MRDTEREAGNHVTFLPRTGRNFFHFKPLADQLTTTADYPGKRSHHPTGKVFARGVLLRSVNKRGVLRVGFPACGRDVWVGRVSTWIIRLYK